MINSRDQADCLIKLVNNECFMEILTPEAKIELALEILRLNGIKVDGDT